METAPLPAAAADALSRLLDDPSPQVREALLGEFQRLGEPALAWLRALAADQGSPLAPHARRFVRELGGENTVGQFLEFVRAYQYDLEKGLLLLERAVYPALDPAETRGFLDAAARRCRQLLLTPSGAREKCRVLNRVLFHEYGFRGDAENYHDPRNSFLGQVVRRRRGLPLTLCALYLLVAARCGIELDPVGLPGRFLVGCRREHETFFVDAYERGAFRLEEDLRGYFRQLDLPFEAAALAPAPAGEVLARCCRNLVNQYTAARDHPKAKLFAEFVHEFDLAHRRHAESR